MLELPRPVTFASYEDAVKWLKDVAFQHPDLNTRFREYLTRYSNDPENYRLTDHQALERLALLLYQRRIVVIVREFRTGGSPKASETNAPAFPLSERSAKPPSSSQQAPANDPATFGNIDAAAQADALIAAAKDGKPFCPE